VTRLFDWFKKWIADVATTPLIITSGVALSALYVVWALAADTLGRPLRELTLNTVGLFITGMLAGGVAQFGIKRYSDDRALAAKHGTAMPAEPRKTQEVTRVDS
jgi:hypothetical protein